MQHQQLASDLMAAYFQACKSRGETPHRALGLVYTHPDGAHPRDYMIAWGIGRGYVEMLQGRQAHPEHWEIREFKPS